jgi:uncharacterized membrane protein
MSYAVEVDPETLDALDLDRSEYVETIRDVRGELSVQAAALHDDVGDLDELLRRYETARSYDIPPKEAAEFVKEVSA